jgi:hypothetical protein
MGINDVRIEINPVIIDEELFSYQRNGICKVGYAYWDTPRKSV